MAVFQKRRSTQRRQLNINIGFRGVVPIHAQLFCFQDGWYSANQRAGKYG